MSSYSRARHSKKCILFFKLLAFIFLIAFIVTMAYILYNLYNSNKNKAIYEDIESDVATNEDNDTIVVILENEKTENMKKVASLKMENQDVKGWLQIDNTIIDYPILQGTDNDYYLKHNYKKEYAKYGSIFAKNECDFLDPFSNIIIYGHNMKDGQMFNELLKYIDKNFYNEHKTIKVATEQGENEYSIVSVFKSRVFYQDEENVFRFYNYTRLNNAEDYNTFIENCKKIQLYDTSTSAEYGEQLVTLITCEYSQENGRFVVVAKKVR